MGGEHGRRDDPDIGTMSCTEGKEGLDTCSGGAHNCTQGLWNVASCCWSLPTGAHAQPPPARSWLQPTTLTFNRGTSGQQALRQLVRGPFWPFSSNKGRQRSMAVLGCEGAASSTSLSPGRQGHQRDAGPCSSLDHPDHSSARLLSPIWRWAAWQPPLLPTPLAHGLGPRRSVEGSASMKQHEKAERHRSQSEIVMGSHGNSWAAWTSPGRVLARS
ncbi:hypothetical protein E4U13_002393 [Claviceps humidiphila]|uniref:Uncharacterized protein n=1 Tax=Claviceps humidiphila TaxID=1294629 RepID=A0A9P7Q1Q1_9HYPO|nr:hypothetical protein E4U13_002393 [Claviceps humidiphila]